MQITEEFTSHTPSSLKLNIIHGWIFAYTNQMPLSRFVEA